MQRIWAVFVREVKAYFDSVIAYVVLLSFFLFSSWLTMTAIIDNKQATLRVFFDLLPALFLFFVPAIAMRLWAEERKLGTIELLMTWPLRHWDLVLGKYFAGLSLIGVAVAMTTSYGFFLYSYGNPDFGPLLTGYLAALLLGGAYLAVACFVSSLTENQIVAYVISVFLCSILYLIGRPEILARLEPLTERLPLLIPLLSKIGFGARFDSVGRGVLVFGDMTFYFTTIVLFLYLNVRIISWPKDSSGGFASTIYSIIAALYCLISLFWILAEVSWIYFAIPPYLIFAFTAFVSPTPRKKSIARRLDAVLACFLALIIGMQLTAIADRVNVRRDFTEKGLYSLSEQTKEIVGKLEDPLAIRIYFSGKVPVTLQHKRQQLVDIFNEFVDVADENITLQFFDPDSDPEYKKQAEREGITLQKLTVTGDRSRGVVECYYGAVLEYLGRKQVFKFLPEPNNLEADLATAIRKLTSIKSTTVGVYAAELKQQASFGLQAILQRLERRLFTVKKLDPDAQKRGDPIPDSIDILIVFDPQKLTEREAYEIDQFVMSGKSLIVVADGVKLNNSATGQPVVTGLENVLGSYGIEILPQVVIANAPTDRLEIKYKEKRTVEKSARCPFGIRSTDKAISRSSVITSRLDEVLFPEASPIKTTSTGNYLTVLVEGPPSSVSFQNIRRTGHLLLDAGNNQFKPHTIGDKEMATPPLAIDYNGPLNSYFRGQVPPEPEGAISGNSKDSARETIDEIEKGRVIVIADTAFVQPTSWGSYAPADVRVRAVSAAQALISNCVDALSGNGDLIPLQNRGLKVRSLERPEGLSNFAWAKWVYLTAPVLLILLAVTRWLMVRFQASLISSELKAIADAEPADWLNKRLKFADNLGPKVTATPQSVPSSVETKTSETVEDSVDSSNADSDKVEDSDTENVAEDEEQSSEPPESESDAEIETPVGTAVEEVASVSSEKSKEAKTETVDKTESEKQADQNQQHSRKKKRKRKKRGKR